MDIASFRIIHISDLHIASKANIVSRFFGSNGDPDVKAYKDFLQTSHDKDATESLAGFLTLQCRNESVDLVLVSGDVAAAGLHQHLEMAQSFLIDPDELGREERSDMPYCGVPKDHLMFMPGNHDRFQPQHFTTRTMAEAIEPDGILFDDVFAGQWISPDDQVGQIIVGRSHRNIVAKKITNKSGIGPDLYVISADFCLTSIDEAEGIGERLPFAYAGQGLAHKEVIADLVKLTKEIQSKEYPNIVIWVSHFPPFLEKELDADKRNLRLIGAKYLREAAEKNGIGIILSGHLHADKTLSFGVTTQIWCTGATTCMDFILPRALHGIEFTVREGMVEAKRYTYEYKRIPGEGRTFVRCDAIEPDSHTWELVHHKPSV